MACQPSLLVKTRSSRPGCKQSIRRSNTLEPALRWRLMESFHAYVFWSTVTAVDSKLRYTVMLVQPIRFEPSIPVLSSDTWGPLWGWMPSAPTVTAVLEMIELRNNSSCTKKVLHYGYTSSLIKAAISETSQIWDPNSTSFWPWENLLDHRSSMLSVPFTGNFLPAEVPSLNHRYVSNFQTSSNCGISVLQQDWTQAASWARKPRGLYHSLLLQNNDKSLLYIGETDREDMPRIK